MKEDKKGDKKEEVKEETRYIASTSTDELLAWLFLTIALCLTLVLITRMHVDSALVGDLIQHYTLRGKDVVVKDDHLVFIN